MSGLLTLIYKTSLLLNSLSVGPTSAKFLGILFILSLNKVLNANWFNCWMFMSAGKFTIGNPFIKPGMYTL